MKKFILILCIVVFVFSITCFGVSADEEYTFAEQPITSVSYLPTNAQILESGVPLVGVTSDSYPLISGLSVVGYSGYPVADIYAFCVPLSSGYQIIIASETSGATFVRSGERNNSRYIFYCNNTYFYSSFSLYYGYSNISSATSSFLPVYTSIEDGLSAVRDYIDNPPEEDPFVDQPIPYVANAAADQASFNSSLKAFSSGSTEANLFAAADGYDCYAASYPGHIVYFKTSASSASLGTVFHNTDTDAYSIFGPGTVDFIRDPIRGFYYCDASATYDVSYLPDFENLGQVLAAAQEYLDTNSFSHDNNDWYTTLKPGNVLYIHYPDDVNTSTLFLNLTTKFADTSAFNSSKTTQSIQRLTSLPSASGVPSLSATPFTWTDDNYTSGGWASYSYSYSGFTSSSVISIPGNYLVIYNPVFNNFYSVSDLARYTPVDGYNSDVIINGNGADAWYLYQVKDYLYSTNDGSSSSNYNLGHDFYYDPVYVGSRNSVGNVTFSVNGVNVGYPDTPGDSWGSPTDPNLPGNESIDTNSTLNLFGLQIPSITYTLSSIWYYVSNWAGTIASGWSLIVQTWQVLPPAMLAPVYGSAVLVVVIGLFRRFIS